MSSNVSTLLSAIERGESVAADQLLPLVYDQLRELARAKLVQETAGQTLQATALVHEAYIRLVDAPLAQKWQSRKHFFAAAAEAMRRILIENARRKQSLKRGGEWDRVEVSLSDLPEVGSDVDLLLLDEAMTRLAVQDAQAAEMVKLRYFTGLSMIEAAELLEMSESSARRLWLYARSFLLEELSAGA